MLARAAVRLQKRREGVHRGGVLAFRDIDHLAARHVHEQADVVVAAARRRLVRRDLRDLGQIESFDGLRNVMIEHPPDPRVVLLDDLGHIGYRHRLDHRKQESLEQQREARARPRPWRRNLLHPAFVTGNPRDRSLQHRLVLKEIQMSPLPLPDVVDAATLGAAGRTGEPAAPREADVQIELFLVAVELGSQHHPRGGQA